MTPEAPQKRPRLYQKHGLSHLKAAVKGLGGRVIDKRTTLGKALQAWRSDLEEDLGGRAVLSTQQVSLIELGARTKLMLDSIDAWLLAQPSLVNVRKRALLPVVRERASLAASFQSLMKDLGLERRARPVESLASIMRSHKAEQSPATTKKEDECN